MCRSVDLPAPFGPSRPVMPGRRMNEMSLTATTLPYQRDASWSSTAAVGSSGRAGRSALATVGPHSGVRFVGHAWIRT